ncbi:conserved protein of unknown function [Kingella kingae]|nr:conserved protein of unknown function [Kingella kingae]
MQAIDTQDNEFHDGNGTTELGTILPAWWLNQVQAELLAVITGAGIAPKRNERNQLQAALRHMITQAKPADASGTTKGIVMLSASTSSTATDKAATPSAVKAAYDLAANKVSLTANQAIAGSKTFTNPIIVGETSGWEKIRFNVKGGHWQLEFNPAGIDGKSLNFLFTSSEKNPQQTRIRFPTVTEHQNVAYESWVEGAINKVVGRFAASNHTHTWASITGKPATFAPAAHTHTEYLPKTGGTIDGNLMLQERSDDKWYGGLINNTNRLGNGYWNFMSNGIIRSGIENVHMGNGEWVIALTSTPSSDMSKDRRQQTLRVSTSSIWTKAYGYLHDYFANKNEMNNLMPQSQQIGDFTVIKFPDGTMIQTGVIGRVLDEVSRDVNFAIAYVFPPVVFLTETSMETYHAAASHVAALSISNTKFIFKMNS